jgi:hypothetical protein
MERRMSDRGAVMRTVVEDAVKTGRGIVLLPVAGTRELDGGTICAGEMRSLAV